MPGLIRKIVIVAAVDGLILHAHSANGPRNNNGSYNEASSIRIDYRTNKIAALPASKVESLEGQDVLEAYGLVGKSPDPAQTKGRAVQAEVLTGDIEQDFFPSRLIHSLSLSLNASRSRRSKAARYTL